MSPYCPTGSGRFLESEPFYWSRRYAAEYGCDITVPNGPGLGDALVFTRVVEDLGRHLGRPLILLTAGLSPSYGLVLGEDPYAIWRAHPFVAEVIDADQRNARIMNRARQEKDNFPHFEHVICGISAAYGIPHSAVKPSLYLTYDEMRWALDAVASCRRPLLCLHRGGTIQPRIAAIRDHLWCSALNRFEQKYGLVQIGRSDTDGPRPGPAIETTSIRQMFALIWAADGFIGFDSGPTHAAAAFDRPSVILWDAVGRTLLEEKKEPGFGFTNLVRWAYPQNENIIVFERFIDDALLRLEEAIGRLVRS